MGRNRHPVRVAAIAAFSFATALCGSASGQYVWQDDAVQNGYNQFGPGGIDVGGNQAQYIAPTFLSSYPLTVEGNSWFTNQIVATPSTTFASPQYPTFWWAGRDGSSQHGLGLGLVYPPIGGPGMVSMLYIAGENSLDSQITIENVNSGGTQTAGVQIRHGTNDWVNLFYGPIGTNDFTIQTVTGVASPGGNIIINPRANLNVPPFAGSGTRCVQVDASGNLSPTTGACASGSGITALTHDVTASGSGSVSAEVTGITDGSSVDWQVSGAFSNGKALGFVAGNLQAVSFQAPLTACTDYVSVTCQTGATDIGGTNGTTTVTGVEAGGLLRGKVVATNITAPATPAAGTLACYSDSTAKDWTCKNDAGTVTHGMQNFTCSANQFATAGAADGSTTCSQASFSGLSGSLACGQTPALTGDVNSSAGSCSTKVVGMTESGGPTDLTIGSISNGQCLVRSGTTVVGTTCSAGGTVTSVTGSGGVTCSPSSPNPNCTMSNLTCSTHQFVNQASTSSGLACAQPAFSDLSGSAACTQQPALTGDVTTSAGSCATTLVNIPDGTTAAGKINFTPIAAPSTPAASHAYVYVDSTSKNLAVKNDAGTVNHGAQTFTCSSHQFHTAMADTGAETCAQPAFSDVSGSLACGQMPALSGDLSSAGGTCSVNVTAIESGGTIKGQETWAATVAPSSPSTGNLACWADSTDTIIKCKNSLSVTSVMSIPTTCSGNQWVHQLGSDGNLTCTQPAFSNLSGSAACSQLPALTGDITTSAGSCATTNPSKGKVLVSGSDTTPDYLANKVESTSGTVAVTTASSGTMLNLNVISPIIAMHFAIGGPAFDVSMPSGGFGHSPDFWLRPVTYANGATSEAFEAYQQVWEYDAGDTYGHVDLYAYVYLCGITITGGSQDDMVMEVTKNGSRTGIKFTIACPGANQLNTQYSTTSQTLSLSATDRIGVEAYDTQAGTYSTGALRGDVTLRLLP